MTTSATDLTVANTIKQQIGHGALAMIGARNLVGDERSLQFQVGRNPKRVTHVRVVLDPSDTYSVEFLRVGRAPRFDVTTVAAQSSVYAEQLRGAIEAETGLYTSL